MEQSTIEGGVVPGPNEQSTEARVPWPNKKDDFELKSFISDAIVVQEAFCKTRNELCAIRRINLSSLGITVTEEDIKKLSQYEHENIVGYQASFVVDQELWVVMKSYRVASIFDLLINEMSTFNRTGPMFDEVTIATVLKEVLRGLDFLHGKSKVHQEIKLENILLGKDGAVYLTDTGIRELIIQKQSGFGNYADFTVRFNEYNRTTYKWDEDYFDDTVSKFDTWCFGVIAIELVTEQTCTEKIPSLDDVKFRSFSKDFKEMISDCLQVEPDKRCQFNKKNVANAC